MSQRLHELFSQAGWRRLIDELLNYRSRGRPFPRAITLQQPSDDERRHHARLMRLPRPLGGLTLRYDLDKISEMVASSGLESDWHAILELLHGTVSDQHRLEVAEKEAWKRFWSQIEIEMGGAFDRSKEWLSALRREGTLKRVSKGNLTQAKTQIEKAAKLLGALPFDADQALADVSARFCGDSHALDAAAPVSTLVLRGLALREQIAFPIRSDTRRELWALFGVVCDELSAPVMVFNLPLGGDKWLSRLTCAAAAENQPVHLTTRLVWASDWNSIQCPPDVYVCENPTVISIAANQFGHRSPPLVCVNGEPATAARSLLRQLKSGGSLLHYHGDFDWPGVAIARRVIEEMGAIPWSFDVAAYRAASRHQGRPLTEKSFSTPWCPELSLAMQQCGIAYDEEVLAVDLLEAVCCEH